MDKLKIPSTPISDSNGNLSPHWERFFESLTKFLRISDVSETGTGDAEADGNWRRTQSGNDLVMQRKESGVWVTKHTFSA